MEPAKAPLPPGFVYCPDCGHVQRDMGTFAECEECGCCPMPTIPANDEAPDAR